MGYVGANAIRAALLGASATATGRVHRSVQPAPDSDVQKQCSRLEWSWQMNHDRSGLGRIPLLRLEVVSGIRTTTRTKASRGCPGKAIRQENGVVLWITGCWRPDGA